eukprot:775083-Prorocentrum_lima.AAC.1
MTSSLVGSEMCIRDRESAPEPSSSSVMWSQEAWHGTPSDHAWCDDPVSYTHLTLPTICSV